MERSTGGYLINAIRNLLGTYTPNPDLNSIAGVDWEYIFTALYFLVFIYFFLKMFTLIFRSK